MEGRRAEGKEDEGVSIGTGDAGWRWEGTSDGSLSESSVRTLSSRLLPSSYAFPPLFIYFIIIFIQKPI